MKNMFDIMKQAKEMQAKMAEMQAEVMKIEVSGQSGGGLVRVTLEGKGDLKAIAIDPSLLKEGEAEILEDLILAAHSDAKSKLDDALQAKMAEVTGGFGLPPGFGM
jgi:DNA-binding YbaB/EbfC family protein